MMDLFNRVFTVIFLFMFLVATVKDSSTYLTIGVFWFFQIAFYLTLSYIIYKKFTLIRIGRPNARDLFYVLLIDTYFFYQNSYGNFKLSIMFIYILLIIICLNFSLFIKIEE